MTDLIKKNGVNFGLILGIVSILIGATLYAINLEFMVSFWIGIIIFFINIGIAIFAIIKSKKGMEGFISFKEAFTAYFITMAIGSAFYVVFMILLLNVIDPGAKEIISELLIEKTVTMMQGMNVPTDAIKEAVKNMQETDNFSPVSQALSYVWSLLFYIIVGLIIAAIFKKNKPMFEN
ncbi:MAG: hypothetical protein BM557_01835 [Flavobacterium sp. MedPE-SWcel]|uniref:DUF4199 domain-containing protein n=1 Tax=uncultured Flavobacterium sp. TaxID=165435 RepID=UPI00091C0860|nr:DUF4199 domain-containing protein [uncultured Flavobacterium sp.]OIQ22140.1 MAG: hypothetical protein BM557_01835 [Flavobacterium sp. MedPE-SWcel]